MQSHHTPSCPSVKTCPVCNTEFVRRDGEPPHKFRVRKTCCRACSFALTARNQRAESQSKLCVVCGKPFTRRDREGSPNFRKRLTCSHECKVKSSAQSRRAKSRSTKICAVCGQMFTRNKSELPYDFKKRKTCGVACGIVQAGRTKRTHARLEYPYPPSFNRALKAAIRKRDGQKCRLCGSGRGKHDLHVHHINYDKQDSRPENLVALCASCHCKTHTRRAYWTRVFRELLE